MWYKQTINNACGLYGILHAISNGDSRDFVGKNDFPQKRHEPPMECSNVVSLV